MIRLHFSVIIINTASLLVSQTSYAFTTTLRHHKRPMSRTIAKASPLDQELESWCKTSGFGNIDKSIPSGRSGWASFQKVTVTNPPKDNNDKPVSFFVKSSTKSSDEMFLGEALGLKAIYECSQSGDDSLRIPKVYHYGDYSGGSKGSLIIMEYLNLAGRSDERALGKAIARMHLAEATEEAGNPNKAFGFAVDNTCGETPQPNPWTKPNSGTKEWIEFYRDYRIGHQLNLAGDSYCSKLWDNCIAPRLHLLFEDCTGENEIKPSLLHGDLWSGNIGSADGKPSIFDPAVYWGHHEAEWGVSIHLCFLLCSVFCGYVVFAKMYVDVYNMLDAYFSSDFGTGTAH